MLIIKFLLFKNLAKVRFFIHIGKYFFEKCSPQCTKGMRLCNNKGFFTPPSGLFRTSWMNWTLFAKTLPSERFGPYHALRKGCTNISQELFKNLIMAFQTFHENVTNLSCVHSCIIPKHIHNLLFILFTAPLHANAKFIQSSPLSRNIYIIRCRNYADKNGKTMGKGGKIITRPWKRHEKSTDDIFRGKNEILLFGRFEFFSLHLHIIDIAASAPCETLRRRSAPLHCGTSGKWHAPSHPPTGGK